VLFVCATDPCDYFRDTNDGLEIQNMDYRWLLVTVLLLHAELLRTAQD